MKLVECDMCYIKYLRHIALFAINYIVFLNGKKRETAEFQLYILGNVAFIMNCTAKKYSKNKDNCLT